RANSPCYILSLHDALPICYCLFVATAKPTVYAQQILEHFELAEYFIEIYGSELNGDRTDKAELIQYILEQQQLQANQCMMVGDQDRKSTRLNSSHVKISYA